MRGWRKARKKAETADDIAIAVAAVAVEPPVALLIDAPAEDPIEAPAPPSAEMVAVEAQLEMQSEVLRLLEVVTSMCDHVIEFIEGDRAERRLMLETLAHVARLITDGAQVGPEQTNEPHAERERVIGGSMPAGPEPLIDLREPKPEPVVALRTAHTQPPPEPESARDPDPQPAATATATTTEIAVEVRGRFGDRWVDGFEICEVMTTPDGPRYRLRRHRDGVVLPELFDATSIRHVETFDQLSSDQLNGSAGYWSRS